MVWLWFLCGMIAGVTLGIIITCAIVFDRVLKKENGGINDNN